MIKSMGRLRQRVRVSNHSSAISLDEMNRLMGFERVWDFDKNIHEIEIIPKIQELSAIYVRRTP